MGRKAERDFELEIQNYGSYMPFEPVYEYHRKVSSQQNSGREDTDHVCSSSLHRIEGSLVMAMKRQEDRQEVPQENEDEIDEMTPLTRARSASTTLIDGSSVGGPYIRGLRRNITGTTIIDAGTSLPPDSTSSVSEEDADDFGVKNVQISRRGGPSPDKARLGSPKSPNPDNRINGGPHMTYERKEEDVVEVVAEAMRELSKIRQKEQSLRPLRVVRQDKKHQPDDALKKQFQQLADDELRIRKLNARDWLRFATWWLLKVLMGTACKSLKLL